MTIRRSIVIIGLMLVALIGGTAIAIKVATDHLLYQSATTEARNWARYLAENVKDLEQIVAGEQPSSTSMAFFQWAQRVGLVFRYEIFNRYGHSQFVSDRKGIALVDVSEYSADAARSAAEQQTIVAVKEGNPPDRPAVFAQAYVPVVIDGRPIAVVAAYVDQTEERNQVYKTFLAAAVALCLLTALAFVIPAIAWYRRTKEKERADRQIR